MSAPPGQFILGNQSLPLPSGFDALPLGEPRFYNGSTPLDEPTLTYAPDTQLQLSLRDLRP